MQRDEIRTCKQIIELIHQLNLQTASARRGKIRVVSDHAHPEGNSAPAEFAANPAHSDYAQRFVVELNTFEILFVPIFAANVCVRLWNLARRRKQQRKRVLSRGNRISAGRIQHNDAAACGRLNVDVETATPPRARPRATSRLHSKYRR